MLKVDAIETSYGSSQVLFGLSLEVKEGQVVTLMGRNGMGKTTTVRSIMGQAPAHGGSITFDGVELTKMEDYMIAQLGLGLVPEGRQVFPNLTVRENLEIATKKGVAPGAGEWTVERIYEMFPALAPLDGNLGGYLSGGEQQMLTIGRTLMGNPSLLLLDEPVEGVAPIVVQELGRQIRKLREMGLTILFSEQNLQFATKISDRAYIIEKGRIQFQGTIEELEKNNEIQEKYLMI